MHHWAEWLEQTHLAVLIRQDLWLYPILEIVHILGIVVLVGPALMFDLRMLGLSKNISVVNLADHLLPWSRRGLFLIIPSGILLFISNAVSLADNTVFWIKLGLIAVAGVNAMLFHRIFFASVAKWDTYASAPVTAKIIALTSMVLWITVICCGRLLAY